MGTPSYETIFAQRVLDEIFPSNRADLFFAALLGDASEGAYDINLAYAGKTHDRVDFEFQLKQRPGKCLACHLTYGLPEVFLRHPVIDVAGVVRQIDSRMIDGQQCAEWTLGRIREVSRAMHVLPLTVKLTPAKPLAPG
ncbi:pancreas/duodenum homeobox protein 1 [uncultured Desulfosarcina sp.]|uniref:pancreas/duodenum homeobox protein 1 n=1 Tax=uncultured Desulfosarcina sp. TaxID=218289 RepID=UPI0029C60A70|nr:pancreas/duodenum homeobox protein 1 [uncultured Desulfosarcina sp.]